MCACRTFDATRFSLTTYRWKAEFRVCRTHLVTLVVYLARNNQPYKPHQKETPSSSLPKPRAHTHTRTLTYTHTHIFSTCLSCTLFAKPVLFLASYLFYFYLFITDAPNKDAFQARFDWRVCREPGEGFTLDAYGLAVLHHGQLTYSVEALFVTNYLYAKPNSSKNRKIKLFYSVCPYKLIMSSTRETNNFNSFVVNKSCKLFLLI